jgi:hypothetical protein
MAFAESVVLRRTVPISPSVPPAEGGSLFSIQTVCCNRWELVLLTI